MQEESCPLCSQRPATFCCYCVATGCRFCDFCLPLHLRESDLVHLPTPVVAARAVTRSPKPRNQFCVDCRAKDVDCVCLCTLEAKGFCRDCFPSHFGKSTDVLHYKLPSRAFDLLDSQPVDQILKRQQYIDSMLIALQANLTVIANFEATFSAQYDELLKSIRDQKAAFLQKCGKCKEKVERKLSEAVRLADNLRYKVSFPPESIFEDLLLNGCWGTHEYTLDALKLFAGEIDTQKVLNALKKCVQVKTNFDCFKKLPIIEELPVIRPSKITLYPLLSPGKPKEVSIPLTLLDNSSSYCYTKKRHLFACGGATHGNAYLLMPATAELASLPPMSTPRSWSGLLNYRDQIYVFGGRLEAAQLATAERFDVKLSKWTPIAAQMLHPRHGTTPCLHQNEIYIVGGFYVQSAEVFSIEKESFRALPISLPTAFAAVSFCRRGELVVIQHDTILTYQLGGSLDCPSRTAVAAVGHCWSNCPPVVLDSDAYFVYNNGSAPSAVFKCDFLTGQLVKTTNFVY